MISIVILNWNGRKFLESCLPSIDKAAERCSDDCEITVVDNASSDSSINYVKETFPEMRILALKENLGFAKAMNIGIRQARSPIVISLNNDTTVEEDFISPLVRYFSCDKDIFAIAAKMLFWDRKTLNFGRAVGNFRFGLFRRTLVDSPLPTNTLYACGGGFAVDRDKFLELGGFDEDMLAFWEDADLCYRAWKRGWRTIYEPKSIVYHRFHGSYIKACGENGIREISGENYFLFMVKNIHDRTLFYQQIFLLPLLMLAAIVTGKSHFAVGLLRSLRRWPLFLEKRRIEKKRALFSDREVFRISSR